MNYDFFDTSCVSLLVTVNPTYDYVVLLHGITRTHRHMDLIAQSFQSNNFNTLQISYPSTKYTMYTLALMIIKEIESHIPKLSDNQKIHFVGHSMGGLLIRIILKSQIFPTLGRIVMIGTPNHGSELANILGKLWFYKKIFGPAGQELKTNQKKLTPIFAETNYELGVIAGNKKGPHYLTSLLLPRKSDGRVSLASTKLKGMKEHIILPDYHDHLPKDPEVIKQTINFIKNGCFLKYSNTH